MSDEIGKIKPKRMAVIVKEDGTKQMIEVTAPAELQELTMPKKKPDQDKPRNGS